MFDYLTCHASLPGNPPEFIFDKDFKGFQTKDLQEWPSLSHFKITSDGCLVDTKGVSQRYTGTVNFYASNARAISGGKWYTTHGEDYEWIEYIASFQSGRLVDIRVMNHSTQFAFPLSDLQ